MNIQNIANEPGLPVPRTAGTSTLGESASPPGAMAEALHTEILAGFRAWRVWLLLGWDDIRQRYRRSILGPFWITLSMGVFILVLGVIYSRLFHTDIATYLPFLSVGYIVWGMLSATANEGCTAFQEGARIIKQMKLPYSVYVLRVVWRNLIIFLHTIVLYIPIAVIFGLAPGLAILYALPGLLLIVVNVTWVAMVLAIVSTRFRDIQPIVATATQLAMFATPIMYPKSALGSATIVAELNPIYHLIELVRAPLLGAAPEPRSWLVACCLAVLGSLFAIALLANKSRRIVFWL